ncbi:diacylglycerol kinase A-like isoform X2 [Leptopilina heterotoma]|uniref:diacylglycerol kinase A-like isoform X2 n=1 Tax=Leptopilina heterotoma TaxID=63436 RepID=UPI001CA7DA79|nr:diacylglycerol kinase A-like isoform X2 [Leptopilina heterotoma]XP_043467137.1 diacylglycerol kinase A-like isoform X2 [Leptopilina heterotoma]
MDDTLNTFHDRDTDCTSRSLATLLVAWVGAAMVASVLLRWKYMWIALAILTLLFLIACGYAACNARSAHQRIACRSNRPIVRRRSIENVQTVSRIVDGNYVVDPPAYQTFWITDLPPSYSAVIRAQPPNYHLTSVDEFAIGPRLSNPPPYTMVIQSDVLNTSNGQPTNRTQEAHLSSFPAGINQQSRGEPWPQNTFGQNNNNNNNNSNIVRRQSFSEISQINEDKEPKERRRSRSIGTHYFSNIIINCTFSRNERRTNDEHINHTPTIEQRVDSNQNHSSSTNDNSESKI